MKINCSHISSIVRSPSVQARLKGLQVDNIMAGGGSGMSRQEAEAYVDEKFGGILDQRGKPFLMRRSAMEVVGRIRIDGNFHPRIFDKFSDGFKGSVIVDDHNMYMFWRDSGLMRGMHVALSGPRLDYHTFGLGIEDGAYTSNYEEVKESFDTYLRLVTFLFFAEIQTVELRPGGKVGTVHTERWKNETKSAFTIVDTSWNKRYVSSGGFDVSGHFRLQPYGAGRMDRRLIFIEEYRKDGYVRGAGSEAAREEAANTKQ